MDVDTAIERVLIREVAPVMSPTESVWLVAWSERALSDRGPEVMAVLGGALSDRLAWVFLSGYQATIYRCFPALPRSAGWTAFVNTEDQTGVVPGTTLRRDEAGWRVSGWKGWVAASDHVERLLVSAGQERLPFVQLDRDEPGVRIESRDAPSYLPELSQGRAEFTDVAVTEDRLTGDDSTFPVFRTAEGAYVRVAFHAFVLGHALRLGGDEALVADALAGLLASLGVVRLELPSVAATVAMRGVDRSTQRLADAFDGFAREHDPALHERWTRDQRLIRGGGERFAARAAGVLLEGR